MTAKMRWGRVSIDGVVDMPEAIHEAYYSDGDRWNGFVCPYFPKEEVEKMNTWLAEFGDGLAYVPDDDAFVTMGDPDCIETFSGVDIDGHHLYPIGNGSWVWENVAA